MWATDGIDRYPPRNAGWQVWNQQRSDEVLTDVALGHRTVSRWSDRTQWIRFDVLAHEPMVDDDMRNRLRIELEPGRYVVPIAYLEIDDATKVVAIQLNADPGDS